MILSASRRTDIPSFYSEWFLNRLREGYVLTKNPMNPSQISRIILTPDNIDCIVFWTKDPFPMMDKLSTLDKLGYAYYFQFTLTPYGKEIEYNLREKSELITTFRQLSERIGNDRIIWRYDPIIINEFLTMEYHIKAFRELSRQICGYTRTCIISFVDIYAKLEKEVKEKVLRSISEEQMRQLASAFHIIGAEYGIEIRVCCEKVDLTAEGISQSSCIDASVIERISGRQLKAKADKNQRIGCGCVESVDIGVYNTCLHGCIYCYANHSKSSILSNHSRHNPKAEILLGTIQSNAKIIDRK